MNQSVNNSPLSSTACHRYRDQGLNLLKKRINEWREERGHCTGGTKVQKNMLDQRCKVYYIHMSLVTVSHSCPHFRHIECVEYFKPPVALHQTTFLVLILTKQQHTAKLQKPKEGAESMAVGEVNWHLLLLLLSRFSCVRLCVTP